MPFSVVAPGGNMEQEPGLRHRMPAAEILSNVADTALQALVLV